MNTTPPDRAPQDADDDTPLNPHLKRAQDDTYGPDQSGTDPMESVSVQKDEGKAWPIIWAAVTIFCLIVAALLLLF